MCLRNAELKCQILLFSRNSKSTLSLWIHTAVENSWIVVEYQYSRLISSHELSCRTFWANVSLFSFKVSYSSRSLPTSLLYFLVCVWYGCGYRQVIVYMWKLMYKFEDSDLSSFFYMYFMHQTEVIRLSWFHVPFQQVGKCRIKIMHTTTS